MQVNGFVIHLAGCVASAASLQYYLTTNLGAARVLLRSFYVTLGRSALADKIQGQILS